MTPYEAELLKQELQDTKGYLVRAREELARANQEIKLLREKIDALARRLFGKKSEQLSPEQLQLLFQEFHAPGPALGKESGPQSSEALSARPAKASRARPRERAPRVPEHL